MTGPIKNDAERRDHVISLRVTEDEWTRIGAAAGRETMSDYVRRVVLHASSKSEAAKPEVVSPVKVEAKFSGKVLIIAATWDHAEMIASGHGIPFKQWRYVNGARDLQGWGKGTTILIESGWWEHPVTLQGDDGVLLSFPISEALDVCRLSGAAVRRLG